MNYKNDSRNDNLIIITIVLTTFLPSTMIFHAIRMTLIGLCFLKKGRAVESIFAVWIFNIALAILAVILVEHSLLTSNIVHEFVRVLFYALIVEVCLNTQVELHILYKTAIIVLGIHFVIQMTQFMGLNIFDPFIINYYLAGDSNNIHYIQTVSKDYAFRSGSIFINPNVYVCYPSLCTGVFLQYYKLKKSIFSLIMIIVAFISVILTGSRMGLITFATIIVLFSLKNIRFSTRITKEKVFAFIIIIVIIANWKVFSSYVDSMRAFNLEEAYDGSLSTKFSGIISYFSISNPLYWITGSLGSPRCTFAIDMEYGYIFAWYGVIGLYWFIRLLKRIYLNKKYLQPCIASSTILTILLTDFAASTILNMSVFPYISVLALTQVKGREYEAN